MGAVDAVRGITGATAPPRGGVFRIERQEGGIAHLVMDDPEKKLNVLGEKALADLDSALGELEKLGDLKGVILRSGKPGSFIAGADVAVIGSITDPEAVRALVRRAHQVFGRLAALPCPTVAAIDGVCLGGGTELALACDSRVASEEPHTQIGLPEVMLGILPGFGGTTRMPRLVGLSGALDLVLSGRALDAKRALKAGLIARAVPQAWLIENAEARITQLAARPAAARRDRYRARTFMAKLLDGNPLGRALVLQQARTLTKKRTGGHYPAPLAAIEVMEHGLGQPLEVGLGFEAGRVSELVVSPTCKNLVRIFLLSEQAKKSAVVEDATITSAPIQRVSLIGAGVMGGGIAELASRTGIEVRMRDVHAASLTKALQTVRDVIAERSKKKRMRPEVRARERDGQMARILPTLELSGLGRADFAMEAVVEDLDIKRRVFAELEVRMRPDAVIATNTSSLSVNALAEGLAHPERFCGFHFFNPVHRMPLVEVVRGDKTSDRTLVTAVAFARRLGKTPVVVKDAPGFVVNRVLMPYLREALHLFEEGYPIGVIDAAMRDFGMPMGPFEVVDEVGLDVAVKVAGILGHAFPDRMAPSPALEKLLAEGRLGKKSGLGFYRHAGKKRTIDPDVRRILGLTRERAANQPKALAERMVLAMVNESARALDEGVVQEAGMVDLAMVFGAGFPPFRGGPLRYADAFGIQRLEARLTALRAEKGERFAPAAPIARLAASGGTFTQPIATERAD